MSALPAQSLTGPQRAAALLILLGEEHGAAIWSEFAESEIKTICVAMAELGPIPRDAVAELTVAFADELTATGAVRGSADRTEELISKLLPPDRVAAVMADVRGAGGRQVWRRLAHVPPGLLAGFLADEAPQTVAVVLSRLGSESAGRVLALLPHAVAADVVPRMLKLGTVRPEALEHIEDMLFQHFLAGPARKPEADRYEAMADRFNGFDRQTEARFMAALETSDRDAAVRVREKMFTFDDVLKLDAAGAQTLLRHVDKAVLGRALKGSNEAARSFFQSNMSTRAAKNLADDMEALGALRMKDVEEAQSQLVQLAKSLADKGEIRVNKGRVDDEVVA